MMNVSAWHCSAVSLRPSVVVSHRPLIPGDAGVSFLKDSQVHCWHQCPGASSHMKPNQYGAVLDWKLEACVYKNLIDFLPFPLLFPSSSLFHPSSSVQGRIKGFYPSARFQVSGSGRSAGPRAPALRGKDSACWGFVLSLTLSHLGIARAVMEIAKRCMRVFLVRIEVVWWFGRRKAQGKSFFWFSVSSECKVYSVRQQGLNLDQT